MSVTQRDELAAAALAGLMTKEATTTEQVRGGKHEANGCGSSAGCLGQGG